MTTNQVTKQSSMLAFDEEYEPDDSDQDILSHRTNSNSRFYISETGEKRDRLAEERIRKIQSMMIDSSSLKESPLPQPVADKLTADDFSCLDNKPTVEVMASTLSSQEVKVASGNIVITIPVSDVLSIIESLSRVFKGAEIVNQFCQNLSSELTTVIGDNVLKNMNQDNGHSDE